MHAWTMDEMLGFPARQSNPALTTCSQSMTLNTCKLENTTKPPSPTISRLSMKSSTHDSVPEQRQASQESTRGFAHLLNFDVVGHMALVVDAALAVAGAGKEAGAAGNEADG